MKRIMLFINSRGESTSSTKKNFKELTNNDRDDELKKNYHDEDIEDDDQDSEDEDDEDDGDDEAEEEEEEEDNNEEFEKSNNLIKKPKKIFTISTASSLNNTTNSNALCLYDSSNFRIYNNEDDKFEERLDFGSLQCATKVFEKAIESFSKAMLCQDSWNILGFLLAISLLFWGIVLEVRGCPALTVMFFFSFIYIQFGNLFFQTSSNAEQFMNKSMEKVKSVTESLKELVQQCTVICCVLSVCMLTLWLDGSISDVLLIYTLFISIFLIIPGNLLQNSSDNLSCKDWDNEIEEFLPVVTEDNMKVLKRAGETGDNSSTPTTPDHDNTLGTFDDDFTGLKMPSHEEGSTDGMEFSELELNIGDTDTDGIGLKRNLRKNKTKNKKLEHSSSSEDELNLKITKVDDKLSDDTDEEFEFIHVQELSNIKNF